MQPCFPAGLFIFPALNVRLVMASCIPHIHCSLFFVGLHNNKILQAAWLN
jgi:hypothetical protein